MSLKFMCSSARHTHMTISNVCHQKKGLGLDEPQAAGSAPSQATFASGLRAIIGIICDGDVRRHYQVVSKRAKRIVCCPFVSRAHRIQSSQLDRLSASGTRKSYASWGAIAGFSTQQETITREAGKVRAKVVTRPNLRVTRLTHLRLFCVQPRMSMGSPPRTVSSDVFDCCRHRCDLCQVVRACSKSYDTRFQILQQLGNCSSCTIRLHPWTGLHNQPSAASAVQQLQLQQAQNSLLPRTSLPNQHGCNPHPG